MLRQVVHQLYCNACGSEFEARTLVTSSHVESGQGCCCGLNYGKKEPNKDALPNPSGACQQESEGTGLMLPNDNSDAKKIADRGANSIEFTAVSHAQSEMISVQELPENALHVSSNAQSFIQPASGGQKECDLESLSGKKLCAIQSHENDNAPVDSSIMSVPIKDNTQLGKNTLANVGAREFVEKSFIETDRTRDGKEHLPSSLLDASLSTQSLRGYPVPGQYMKEIKEDTNCKRHALQQILELSGNLHSDQHTDFTIQKCTRPQNEVLQAALPSQDKNSKDNSRSVSGSSADSKMPSTNGDVKLFGKILISSQQNPTTCGDYNALSETSVSKFDCTLYPVSDDIPVRSMSLGDGNRTLVGFPPPSDSSSLLLAKYPSTGAAASAFSNLSTFMVKLEPRSFHGVVRTNTSPSNGVSILPSREHSSSSGVIDCQVITSREVQPLMKDVKLQAQDVLLSEMQRTNRLNAVQGMQMQQGAIGMLGINVLGGRVGVVVGGSQSYAAGVSDPVSAMKMQFIKES